MDSVALTNEQTDKVLELQNLTGIEDMNVCRDVLIRHQWDLEVAFQEQLNMREGRPTMYAASHDVRAPVLVNDRFLQQIFSANMPGGRSMFRFASDNRPFPRSFTGVLGYLINIVFQYCYSTLTSIVSAIFSLGRNPRMVTDPVGDVNKFIAEYNDRYPDHPVFYQGTFAQALSDAKQELRFLLIYLHKDPARNPDVDSLCRTTLSSNSVIEYINRNMILWGCDVATPEGFHAAQATSARVYPSLLLIGLRSNRMVIMGRMEGDCTPEELVRRLRTIINGNEMWLNQARNDRLERNFTQLLRQQQDEAYQLSLRADEEKELRKQEELEKQRLAEEARQRQIEETDAKKRRIAQQKIDLADLVPTEPQANDPNVISVVFKMPNGARIERRFRSTDSMVDVYNYVFCHPSSPDEFEITTNFPKRVIYSKQNCTQNSSSDSTHSDEIGDYERKTLAEVGLKNREVLFVNDLDA